jgi:ABC-2 type transport system permease protein
MISLILRIIRQMKNDPRTMALMLLAPVVILTLLFFLLSNTDYKARLLLSSELPDPLATALASRADVIRETGEPDLAAIDRQLLDRKADAYIYRSGNNLVIRMRENDAVKLKAVSSALQSAMASLGASQVSTEFLLGTNGENMFQDMGYILLGVLSFFFVFIIAGIAFVRERESGTLERLMITPVRRRAVVAGYTLGYGLFAAIQAIFIILYTQIVLGLPIAGSVALVILVMVLLAFSAVATGTFVSIFANNEFQVMQFIPVVIIPQIFFSGLLNLDTLPYGLGRLAWIMPIHYGCSALKIIMVDGGHFGDIWLYLVGLLAFNAVLAAGNILALRKYRQI